MWSVVIVLCSFYVCTESVLQNGSCPVVSPRELDLKELDGKWYLAAVATELQIQGDCAMVVFNHKTDNTTDISISWISNTTISYYNGSIALTFDPNSPNNTDGDLLVVTYTDQKTETYSFLDVDYEHYAIVFACYDNEDGNSSTYELWELTRAPHPKPKHVTKIYNKLKSYNLDNTPFINFNNTDASCLVSEGHNVLASFIVTSAAAAVAAFRRLF